MGKKFIYSLLGLVLISYSFCEAKNAGILVYTTHHGKVKILLTREAKGSYKGEWDDFGGKEEPEDKGNIKKIAIREFTEESKGAFGKAFKQNITDLTKASKKYIKSKIPNNNGIANPGTKIPFYSLFLAKVDYLDPLKFKARGLIPHHEKDEFEWVDAREFLDSMADQTHNLQDYYNYLNKQKKGSRFSPKFGNKPIRKSFAIYFMDPTTRNKIEKILRLPTTRPARPSYPSEQEYEPGWGPAPSRREAEYVPSWGKPAEIETEETSEEEYEEVQQHYLPQYLAYQQQQYPSYQYPTQHYQPYQYPAQPMYPYSAQPYQQPYQPQPTYHYPAQAYQPAYEEEPEEERWIPTPTRRLPKKPSNISPLQENLEKLTKKLAKMKGLLQ